MFSVTRHPDSDDFSLINTSRRYATRYEPNRREACLSWWEPNGPDEAAFELDPIEIEAPLALGARSQFALLLDISQTGASIALDRLPQCWNGIRLRLEGDGLPDGTEAEVVGVTTTTRGPHLVRLAFRAPCSFETLMAAVCG